MFWRLLSSEHTHTHVHVHTHIYLHVHMHGHAHTCTQALKHAATWPPCLSCIFHHDSLARIPETTQPNQQELTWKTVSQNSSSLTWKTMSQNTSSCLNYLYQVFPAETESQHSNFLLSRCDHVIRYLAFVILQYFGNY